MTEIWRHFLNDEIGNSYARWLDAPGDFKEAKDPAMNRHLATLRYQTLADLEPKAGREYHRFTLQELVTVCQKRSHHLSKAVVYRLVNDLLDYIADNGWLTDGRFDSKTGKIRVLPSAEVAENTPFRLIFNPQIQADFQDYLADLAQLANQAADLVYYHRQQAREFRLTSHQKGRKKVDFS